MEELTKPKPRPKVMSFVESCIHMTEQAPHLHAGLLPVRIASPVFPLERCGIGLRVTGLRDKSRDRGGAVGGLVGVRAVEAEHQAGTAQDAGAEFAEGFGRADVATPSTQAERREQTDSKLRGRTWQGGACVGKHLKAAIWA